MYRRKNFELEDLAATIGMDRSSEVISGISYISGVYTIKDRAGVACYAKGALTTMDAAGGKLMVHLINDFTSTGAKAYTALPLGTNDVKAAIFDEIKETGTTISLAEVILAVF